MEQKIDGLTHWNQNLSRAKQHVISTIRYLYNSPLYNFSILTTFFSNINSLNLNIYEILLLN